MNPIGKLDLDAQLRSWPSPARDEAAWEERADAIVQAALVAKDKAGSEMSSALLEAPSLDPEPGEPQAPILTVVSVGEKKMSQESDQSAPARSPESVPPSATPSTVSPKSTERKRGSLREIAARASQAGAASRPGSVTPPPPSASRTGATGPVSAVAAASTSRPSEAGLEDSGIVDLKGVKEKATPEQVAAAEKATPASKDLFEDGDEKEKPAAAAATAPAAAKSPAVAKAPVAAKAAPAARPAEKKRSSGAVVGGVIAVLGLAAAFAITKMNKPATPAQPAPVAAESQPATASDTKVEQGAQPLPAPAPVAATDGTAEPAAPTEPGDVAPSGGEPSKIASTQSGGNPSAPAGGGPAQAGGDKEPAPAGDKPSAPAAPGATGTAAPGDLKGAMAQAVGGEVGKGAPTAENAEPAAGSRSQNVPEQPSQGSVQAAIGSVMGGAKSCVAGADDVSRAQITFASNGAVKSVSVTGWATSHGATGCIKTALQGAKVGPFSKSTYVVGVTIRP